MKGYKILNNDQLNLATAWEKFQQDRFGNILTPPYPLQEIPDPIEKDETDQRLAEQVNNLYE